MRCTALGPITVNGSMPGSPQERRLLAVFLAHCGAPVSVDRLADVVWGDAPPHTYLNALQSKISRLRTTLGSDRIRRVGNAYVLDLPDGTFDAQRFDDLLASANGLPAADQLATIDEALALWHGRAFEEFADEEFARPTAVGLEERRLGAHERRLDLLLEVGDHHEVIGCTDELIDQDPFRERFWGARMEALAANGRSIDALRCFQQARERFIDETGVAPSSALVAIEQRILAMEAAHTTNGTVRADPGPDSSDDTRSRMDTARAGAPGPADEMDRLMAPPRRLDRRPRTSPLVERTTARSTIERALDDAGSGHPRLVCVLGPVGVGKTRLLEVATSAARARGLRAITTRCVPDLHVPLGPLGQAMEALGVVRPVPADTSRRLDPYADGAVGEVSAAAVLRLIDRLIVEPTVLVIDDLQALDTDTAAALDLLVAEVAARSATEPVPLLVMTAHRGLDGSRPTDATIDHLLRGPGATTIDVDALDEAGTAALVAGMLGTRASGAAVSRVHELSGGVPLLVANLLETWSHQGQLLVRAGCVDIADDAAPAGSAAVDAVLGDRWAALSSAAADTAVVLAACPLLDLVEPAMVTSVVAATLGCDHHEAIRLLDELTESALLVGEGRRRFASARVRSFVLQQPRRDDVAVVLERLTVELLETPRLTGDRTLADRHPALAGRCLEQLADAGFPVDADVAGAWSLRAGEAGLGYGAWAAAAHHLTLARAHLGDDERLSDGTPLPLALGLAMFRAHDEFRAQAVLAATAERATDAGDAMVAGKALCAIHRIAISFVGASELAIPVEEARRLLTDYADRHSVDEPVLAAAAYGVLAEDAAVADEPDHSTALVARARSTLETAHEPVIPEVDFADGLGLLHTLELPAACRRFVVSRDTAVAAGDRWVASWGAGRLALAHLIGGDVDATERAIADALALQWPIRLWSELALTRAIEAAHHLVLDEPDAALEAAEESDHLATRSGYPFGQFLAVPISAAAHLRLGDADRAGATLDRFREVTGASPWPYRVMLHLAADEPDAAREIVEPRLGRLPSVPTLNRLAAIAATAAVAGETGDERLGRAVTPLLEWLHDRGVRRLPAWPTRADRRPALVAATVTAAAPTFVGTPLATPTEATGRI